MELISRLQPRRSHPQQDDASARLQLAQLQLESVGIDGHGRSAGRQVGEPFCCGAACSPVYAQPRLRQPEPECDFNLQVVCTCAKTVPRGDSRWAQVATIERSVASRRAAQSVLPWCYAQHRRVQPAEHPRARAAGAPAARPVGCVLTYAVFYIAVVYTLLLLLFIPKR